MVDYLVLFVKYICKHFLISKLDLKSKRFDEKEN